MLSTIGIFDRSDQVLKQYGALSLSAYSLQAEVQKHGVDAYWVGPKSDSRYSVNFLSREAVQVNYLAVSSKSAPLVDPIVSFTTYDKPREWGERLRGVIHAQPNIIRINSHGDQVSYASSDLAYAVVDLAGGMKGITMRFDSPQSESALIEASEKLRLVS